MLNVQQTDREINTERRFVLCIDVSRDWLEGFAVHRNGSEEQMTVEVRCRNQSGPIEKQLDELDRYASNAGLEGLQVVCEPTGGFESKIFRIARELGHQTAYVNSEHVAKMSVIESGDTGKTDSSDARVISLVAQLNRTQKTRFLGGEYRLLRELGKEHEDVEKRAVRARCRIIDTIRRLFCDYDKNTEFVFLSTGQALMDEYRWNPYRMVEESFEDFRTRVKGHVKRVREKTLSELWKQATSSARHVMPEAYQQLLEHRLHRLWREWERHEQEKDRLDTEIARLYQKLEEQGEVPAPFERLDRGQLGRFIGETGPLDDFDHWRQVLSYAGLNIRERESGTYQGEKKITKKGRERLRKVISRMAFALVTPGGLYANYYQRKLESGMSGIEARVAVMRKVAKLIFGLYRSDRPYDRDRVFTCQSEYTPSS